MKPNVTNYTLLCRAMYEFTGNQYWLNRPANLSAEISMGTSFFSLYWEIYHELKKRIASGEVCRYNLIKLSTGEKLPCIINSLSL